MFEQQQQQQPIAPRMAWYAGATTPPPPAEAAQEHKLNDARTDGGAADAGVRRLTEVMGAHIDAARVALSQLVETAERHQAEREGRVRAIRERQEDEMADRLAAEVGVALMPLRQRFIDDLRPFATRRGTVLGDVGKSTDDSSSSHRHRDRHRHGGDGAEVGSARGRRGDHTTTATTPQPPPPSKTAAAAAAAVATAAMDRCLRTICDAVAAEATVIDGARAQLPGRLRGRLPAPLLAIPEDSTWHPVAVCIKIALSQQLMAELEQVRVRERVAAHRRTDDREAESSLMLNERAALHRQQWFAALFPPRNPRDGDHVTSAARKQEERGGGGGSSESGSASASRDVRAAAALHILQDTLVPLILEELERADPRKDMCSTKADLMVKNVSSLCKLLAVAARDHDPLSLGMKRTVQLLLPSTEPPKATRSAELHRSASAGQIHDRHHRSDDSRFPGEHDRHRTRERAGHDVRHHDRRGDHRDHSHDRNRDGSRHAHRHDYHHYADGGSLRHQHRDHNHSDRVHHIGGSEQRDRFPEKTPARPRGSRRLTAELLRLALQTRVAALLEVIVARRFTEHMRREDKDNLKQLTKFFVAACPIHGEAPHHV